MTAVQMKTRQMKFIGHVFQKKSKSVRMKIDLQRQASRKREIHCRYKIRNETCSEMSLGDTDGTLITGMLLGNRCL